MQVPRRWIAAIAIMLAAACGYRPPALPSQGGPVWHELKTAHFTLWTDTSLVRARALLQQLELRQQVIAHAMNETRVASRAFILAPEDEADIVGYGARRAFAGPLASLDPWAVFAANAANRDRTINHELTHVISYSLIQYQPRWLAEGLAAYFENIDLANTDSVTLGLPHASYASHLNRNRPLSAATLFAWRDGDNFERYASSWALVAYLINEQGDAFARYLTALRDDSRSAAWPVDLARLHDAAWRAAFGALSLDELDERMRVWLRVGHGRFPVVAVRAQPAATVERVLGDADVLAARGALAHAGPHADVARRLLGQALAQDPTHVLANLLAVALGERIAVARARAVAVAHPDDWRVHWLVFMALRNTPYRHAAWARLCAAAPSDQACDPRLN